MVLALNSLLQNKFISKLTFPPLQETVNAQKILYKVILERGGGQYLMTINFCPNCLHYSWRLRHHYQQVQIKRNSLQRYFQAFCDVPHSPNKKGSFTPATSADLSCDHLGLVRQCTHSDRCSHLPGRSVRQHIKFTSVAPLLSLIGPSDGCPNCASDCFKGLWPQSCD